MCTKKIFITLLALGTLTLAACNTFQGAGEDIEVAGENLQQAAHDNK